MDIYTTIFITLIAAVIVAVSQILFKKGIGTKRISPKNLVSTLLRSRAVLIGIAGYLVSLCVYLFALGHAPLSVVYPIFASSFIFVVIFSILFLKEKLSVHRAIGIALIFIGIVVVALSY